MDYDPKAGTGRTTKMLQDVVEYMSENPNYSVVVVVSTDEEIQGVRRQLLALGAEMNNIYIEQMNCLSEHRLTTRVFWDHRAVDELEKRRIEEISKMAEKIRANEP